MKTMTISMLTALVAAAALCLAPLARADTVLDWNAHGGAIVSAANMPTPPANRLMAIAHTAAYVAANAITHRYPASEPPLQAPPGASVEAAIAAAHRSVLLQLLPSQKPAIEAAYQTSLGKVADLTARDAGVAVGERAAAQMLAQRATDGAALAEAYRPLTTPGRYVPTAIPAVPQWPQRKPWLLTNAAQFRPGPPPTLDSALWARDYNEIKALGARRSTTRTADQTAIALFWESTLPPIYHGLVRCVAEMPGREVTRNARLFAAATQATDDALIAVFDAKYHYAFWRPITAIRNGDIDGNPATEPEPSWLPLIDTPMHPEYPCAHCIQAAAIAAVLEAELGAAPQPRWTTTSASAQGTARAWPTLQALVQEVNEARILDGVHYRNSTEVGADMGRRIGSLAAARWLGGP